MISAHPALDVTIIVPCRNEARYVEAFLTSLAAGDYGGLTWEAIIADGRSNDGTRERIRAFAHPNVRVIDNPELIVSTGLNRAILDARGEFIVRMDMHTEYAPDYVRRCIEILKDTGAANAGGPARTRAHGFWSNAIAGAYHSRFACGGARFHDENYAGPVDTVTYGCWRKETLLQLGLFDESLVRNQDDELNLRTIRAGGTIWQSPAIVSWYHPRGSLAALWRQYFQYGYWKVAVIRKHRLPASWRHLVPGAFVLSHIVLAATSLIAAWLQQTTVAAAALALWAFILILYLGAAFVAAAITAKARSWYIWPILPIVFACYHCSYGSGFLVGMARWAFRPNASAPGKAFTALSR